MQESRVILNQSMRSKSLLNELHNDEHDTSGASHTVRNSLPGGPFFTTVDQQHQPAPIAASQTLPRAVATTTIKTNQAPKERFDFSEIHTDRSLSRGANSNSARLRLEELSKENTELREQVTSLKVQKTKAESNVKRLESVIDAMQADVKRAKCRELLYDEE